MANELKLANPLVIGSLAADPAASYSGEIYYNTGSNVFRYYNGSIWQPIASGSGTVTSVSVVSANGFAGTVATATTTPAITISTTVTGILYGNGTSVTAAIPSNFPILNQNTTGTASTAGNVTGVVAIVNGGTGQTSAASAFAALSPLSAAGDIIYENASPTPAALPIGTTGQVLTVVAGLPAWMSPATSGTVTSISVTVPSILSVSPPTITTAGTFAITLATEAANTVFAGPTSGGPAIPTFRLLGATDIPDLSATYVTQSEVGAPNGVASLDGAGKVPIGQLPSAVMEYEGAWDPTTNTPTLVDGTGTNGFVYYVTAAFAGPIGGLSDPSMHNFQIGDLVIYSGTLAAWQLVSPANGVQSVNGMQGVVIVNAINQLTGDVTTAAASGSQSEVATISAGAVTASKLGAVTDGITTDQSGPGGTIEVAPGGISNTQIASAAAISLSKLFALNPNRSLFSDASGFITDANLNTPNMVVNNLKFGPTTSDYIEEQYVHSITLTDNTSSAVAVDASTTFAFATYSGYQAEYYITDGSSPTITRMGKLSIVSNSDGSIASLTDSFNDTADIGVVFSAVTNGANVELRYTTTSSGSDRTMRIKIDRFLV